MRKKTIGTLTVTAMLIGFMLAIQFNSLKESEPRDTRDLWDLREALLEARELETKLLREIRTSEEKIVQYQEERLHSPEQAVFETLKELRMEAGLQEITGPGITISLYPATSLIIPGQITPYLSPEVLRKLVNELNMYGAKEISIQGQRVVNTTVIREIQGETKIDGYPLKKFPIEIKVLAENKEEAKKLYNMMQISSIPDDFFVDNILLEISEPLEEITIPPYDGEIRVEVMESIGEGADS